MESLKHLVVAAQAGDIEAYGRLVEATQRMACAVALGVLRDGSVVQDAVQQAYLRAFRRLSDLEEPAAFPGWLRRIVITIALNMRRARRRTLLRLDDIPEVPVLDEAETRWSDLQRHRLTVKIVPTEYAMCRQAWELEVESDGHWSEVLAWGVFTDRIVSHLGGDPSRHTAIGVGYGLERLAMLRYGIDDIRKLDVASVAESAFRIGVERRL